MRYKVDTLDLNREDLLNVATPACYKKPCLPQVIIAKLLLHMTTISNFGKG